MRGLKRGVFAAGVLTLLGALGFILVLNGAILLNHPDREDYPVRGVDISHWQGEIQWPVLAGQDISFAYIKATEGSTHADPRFEENWPAARKSGLRVGAYHFFSYDSPGASQAENFIANVPAHPGMLPPVIDVEFYGDYFRNPPARDAVQAELDTMIAALTDYYGMRPVVYATQKAYNLYLAGAYEDCDIWIRSVFTRPKLSDGRAWTIWQYTDRERLSGYSGAEEFIDMNVFCGSAAEFENWGQ